MRHSLSRLRPAVLLPLLLVALVLPARPGVAQGGLPLGTVVNSATFSIYVRQPITGATVNVHRILAPWAEDTVTWASLGGAFAPAVLGSFAATEGWHSVDVTALVQGWVSGTYPNYGLLLEQAAGDFSALHSSEYWQTGLRPKLDVCYTPPGGAQICQTLQRPGADPGGVADTRIDGRYPMTNYGAYDSLFTGLEFADGAWWQKQSMVRFELPAIGTAGIGDFVWYDQNQNGIEEREAGIPGVEVRLYTCAGAYAGSTTTNEGGFYQFTDLVPGDYYVEFILPPGYFFTLQNQGIDEAVDSDAHPTSGRTACTTLTENETDLTVDAGMYAGSTGGCTLTPGYWKTHSEFGPAPYDDTWALLPSGASTPFYLSGQTYYRVLWTPPKGGNAYYILAHAFIAAGLNRLNGATSTAEVDAAMTWATTFFTTYTPSSTLSKAVRAQAISNASLLDGYNNGYTGPGHCAE